MDKKTKIKFNIIAVICIIIFAFALAPKTLQNDTFYTISIGQHIMENGIVRQDPFTWADLNYTYPHWLYDVCTYFVFSNFGGFTGIYIVTAILSCILGVTLYFTSKKIVKKPLFSFVITIGVMFLLKDYIAARAQLVTFILFTLEILLIECFLDTKKKRYVLGLMLIACLIANMHAAVFYFFFILMLPYIGEYILVTLRDANLFHKIKIHTLKRQINKLSGKEGKEEKLAKLQEQLAITEEKFIKYKENMEKRKENPYRIKLVRRDAAKWLILICVLCFVMGLLTPIGDEPYTHIFKLMSGNTTQNISEHQPLTLSTHKEAIVVIEIILVMLIFTDTKITLKDLFMIGGLLVLTFMSRRQFSMFVLIGGISITKLIVDFIDKYDKNGIDDFTKLAANWKGALIAIVLTVACAISLFTSRKSDEYVSDSRYPVEAADYILTEVDNGNIDLSTMRLYNDYNYGSYLLYRGIPVFIDSRADLYSPEFNEETSIFDDYMNISGISVWYENQFKKYEMTHIMTYLNSKLNMLLERDEKYKELYKDDYFILYERLGNQEN